MSDWTPEHVTEMLARDPGTTPEGRKVCPLCWRDFPTSGALGPHYAAHRRAVGINPPRKQRNRARPKPTNCPICQAEVRTDNLRRHLMTVHDMSPAQARQAINAVPGGALTLPPLNGEPAPLPDFNGAEAITGVLAAACPNGTIPIRVIPLVTQLVTLAEIVLSEVRK